VGRAPERAVASGEPSRTRGGPGVASGVASRSKGASASDEVPVAEAGRSREKEVGEPEAPPAIARETVSPVASVRDDGGSDPRAAPDAERGTSVRLESGAA